MVSQSRVEVGETADGTPVSIPVRGSGKSKIYSARQNKAGKRVSIPVRGSGKSKCF